MEIITLTCPNCDTIVAENVLEEERVMKCPYYDCDEILSFEDLQQGADRLVRSQPQSE